MGTQLIDTDFRGPIPKDTVGLLWGRSSSSLQGLIVHPGEINPDYEGIIKVMAFSPRGLVAISPGDRIAQLLIIPSLHGLYPAASQKKGRKRIWVFRHSAYLSVITNGSASSTGVTGAWKIHLGAFRYWS
jgi:deoxycytidine triphosphate deaminase